MNVDWILNHQGRLLDQWQSAHPNASAGEYQQIMELTDSYQFKQWYSQHPSGTVDDYLYMIQQEQAYKQSPQYQIDNLQSQVEMLSRSNIEYSETISSLKDDIVEYEDKIHAQGVYIMLLVALSVILLVSTGYFYRKSQKAV